MQSGQRDSLDLVVTDVYDELRAIAHRHLRARRRGPAFGGERQNSLSTTGVVHEAYLKLVDQSQVQWRDRAHFLAIASVAMRHVLIDRARAQCAHKRGGVRTRVSLEADVVAPDEQPEVVLEIDEALKQLSLIDARLAQVVEYRFFGGLSEDEAAAILGVTVRTVQRDWAKARMLLRRALDL